MINETEEVYDSAFSSAPDHNGNGSGIPKNFDFLLGQEKFQVFRSENQINIYCPKGGCIVLYRNGTWEGDIAPFCG